VSGQLLAVCANFGFLQVRQELERFRGEWFTRLEQTTNNPSSFPHA